jgi:hypothetical protein
MIKLPPEDQAFLLRTRGSAFEPAAGAWGRAGSTLVHLRTAPKTAVRDALRIAWQAAASPKGTSSPPGPRDQRAASRRSSQRRDSSPPARDENVEAFLASLKHPLKREILALRQIIRGADATIAEGIKWNAPSFRTTEWFATLHLRAKAGVQVILHLGAKKRASTGVRGAVTDPMLTWLGPDRASVVFADRGELSARRAAFTKVIREWIRYV